MCAKVKVSTRVARHQNRSMLLAYTLQTAVRDALSGVNELAFLVPEQRCSVRTFGELKI